MSRTAIVGAMRPNWIPATVSPASDIFGLSPTSPDGDREAPDLTVVGLEADRAQHLPALLERRIGRGDGRALGDEPVVVALEDQDRLRGRPGPERLADRGRAAEGADLDARELED